MKPPDFSLERLAELRLPYLDPGSIDLHGLRRDPAAARFDWVDRIRNAPALRGERVETARTRRVGRPIPMGPMELSATRDRVALSLDGQERWVIDTKAFTGTSVSVTVQSGVILIALTDALFPGTTLPADLKARIWQESGVWQLRLRLKFGGFDATLPLQDWLTGAQLAVSDVAFDLTALPLGPASGLVARGAGKAVFTPGWILAVMGADSFVVEGVQERVTADLALVAALPVTAPQMFFPTTYRRTLVLLASAEQFPLVPELGTTHPRFELDSFRFDSLAFEAGVDPSDAQWRVLVAQSVTDPTTLSLVTGGDLRATDGRPFRVPLANPLYVVLFDEARTQVAAALTAQGPPAAVWMHSPTCSLLVQRSQTVPVVGALALPGQDLVVNCRLQLLRTAFHLSGLMVGPQPAVRTEVLLTWQPLPTPLPPRTVHVEVDSANAVATVRMPPGATTSVVRRDDFLVLGFEFREMEFAGRGTVGRFRPVGGQKPFLTVVLPPQSVGEEAFFETDADYKVDDSDAHPDQKSKTAPDTPPNKLPLPPVKALLARPSRLVYGLPEAIAELSLDAGELLDWNRLTPSLAATALPGGVMLMRATKALVLPAAAISAIERRATASGSVLALAPQPLARPGVARGRVVARNLRPIDVIAFPLPRVLKPSAPSATQTALEVPFRLLVSPSAQAAWVHAMAPVTHDGRTELWHTRLALRSGGAIVEDAHPDRTLRAIWSRDHDIVMSFDRPFLMPLDQDDRRQLVHLTADYSLPVPPRPIGVRRFMLSALGAWMDTEFEIEPPQGFSVEQWRHRATLGRDHYVRVVYKGFLFPFGHRASLVKITERKIQRAPDGAPTAYLRQRMFIVVRERDRLYPPPDDPGAYAHGGRETPLRHVRITTAVTPNLDPPQGSPLGTPVNPPMKAFWPQVGAQPFSFHLKAWDWEGREEDHLAPLAFVRADHDMAVARQDFNNADVARRTYALGGQQVALAETGPGSLSRTSLETESVTFTVVAPASTKPEPPCYPRLAQAAVFLPALRQIAGPGAATAVSIDKYIADGYDPVKNKAEVFAKVVGTPPGLDYAASGSADKSGGVATPSMAIRALSRELGVVGDGSDSFAQGNFDPNQFFPSNAKLLGGIGLAQILGPLLPTDFLGRTPALVTENTPTAVRTRLDWETTNLVSFSVFRNQRAGIPSKLVLRSELVAPKNNTPPSSTLSGMLTDFTIDFASVVEVRFQKLAFSAVSGKKPDVHVVIDEQDGVLFKGPLSFVQTIKEHLDVGGFTDPPFLDISPAGVQLGYTLAIPTIAVGVFSLQNLALGARLMLPFTGQPIRLRFNLSERESPFLVSVAPFGGGGFFALAVGVDGVEVLEVSVEFGGNIAIDLGVASGGVYVMAGIYIKIELATPEKSLLTGYVRLGGNLQVLGIISVSIEFYLGLTYAAPKAWGEAKVTVKVEILMISKSVTVTARKEFAGGEGDPPFAQLMPQPRWAEYAAAFA